jgi:aromatic ring hydroxylase
LSTNGNGFWSFFQQHLIDWNARKPFDQKLSKLREAYFKEEEATVILDDVLLPKNQAKNLDIIKKEIFKK